MRLCEQGSHVQAFLVLAHIVYEDEVTLLVDRLSVSFKCKLSVSFVAGCVVVVVLIIFMIASITFALIQQPVSRLFGCLTLTSTGT